MASSPPPPSLTSKRLESLSSIKSTLGAEHVDDASSFTSISSNSNATVCRICKYPESLTAPLIPCCTCKSRYHRACPTPRITDRKAKYTCGRCLDKAKKNSAIAPAITRNGTETPKGDEAHEIQQVKATQNVAQPQTTIESQQTRKRSKPTTTLSTTSMPLCETEKCGKVAVPPKAPNTRYLCFMCNLVERNETARYSPKPPPASAPRPFQKTKLYHLRPDDRPLVTNKRKRISSSSAQWLNSLDSAVPKANSNSNKNGMSTPSQIPAQNRAKRQTSELANAPQTIHKQPVGVASHGEPSRVVSPVIGGNSPRVFNNPTSVRDSPEHDPSLHDVSNNTYKDSLVRDNVSKLDKTSRLADNALNASGVQGEEQISTGGDFPLLERRAPSNPSFLTISYPEMPSQESQFDEVEDDKILDAVDSRHPFGANTPQPPSPMSDASSYHTPSPKIPAFKAVAKSPIPSLMSLVEDESEQLSDSDVNPNSSVDERPEEFDESVLDKFLLKQSQRDPFYEPSPNELSETQNWGAIDPRTVWPKRWNAAQKEEKMIEIQARGGRKANFGKILHPQLVKERLERGWDIHQSGEKRDDDETREMIQKLEELFGVPEGTMGNCVPKTIGGKLVMQEREREPEPRRPGRQKKEVPLRVYPVIGGQ
ncbi:hypothetical protein BKA65DRAFT_494733 [Rhexocercosporidium sp. MPI-PUGE-AT-0058]|nr:hypothetical protein BKA65DRAFT_494733 [Rhexocercosporidium sp. MPI-PUGE-AT-0058]